MGITEMLDELKSKDVVTRSFGQNFWKQGKMHSLSAHFVGNAENWDMRSTIWI